MKISLIVFLASIAVVTPQGYNYPHIGQQHLHHASSHLSHEPLPLLSDLPHINDLPPQHQQLAPPLEAPQHQHLHTVPSAHDFGHHHQLSQPLSMLHYSEPPQQQQLPDPFTPSSQYLQPQQPLPLVMQISPSVQLTTPAITQHPLPMRPFLSQPAVKHSSLAPRAPSRPKKPIITKSFFVHSAPDETEEDIQEELAQLAHQPRKHYNVLFIKSPSQTNKAAALNFVKGLNEEKTVVYVLTKKTTAADLQDAVRDVPQRPNKPEVFFIKYRTPEEAANAQREIQSQYDSLGGSSTLSDEGLAPVTSVIGSLDVPPTNQEDEISSSQVLEDIVDNVIPATGLSGSPSSLSGSSHFGPSFSGPSLSSEGLSASGSDISNGLSGSGASAGGHSGGGHSGGGHSGGDHSGGGHSGSGPSGEGLLSSGLPSNNKGYLPPKY